MSHIKSGTACCRFEKKFVETRNVKRKNYIMQVSVIDDDDDDDGYRPC